ncbi:signal peptidase I [Enterococcus lemanii]|uniref:Signal peptidase I n=1 Tax=Enterococcus lemanii TaxID=1159752 RepID=A0ABV9MW67_9ENTE
MLSLIIFFMPVTLLVPYVRQYTGILSDYSIKVVLTNSMADKIPAGSIVITRKVKPDKLKEGDVISFFASDETVTHRITKKIKKNNEYLFQTKGDANQLIDNNLVNTRDIQGKVLFFIPKIGIILQKMQHIRGKLAFLLTLLSLNLVYSLISQLINFKHIEG